MIKPAFSTVACPNWTLQTVAERGAEWGYPAVELRTFGEGSRHFACDPALTSPEKVRRLFVGAGVQVCSIATSVAFDEQIKPPVLGLVLSDTEVAVRAAKRAVDLAAALECPLVRVFGFELTSREKRAKGVRRIADRLKMVADHADRTGVRLALENGGTFASAADLAEVLDVVDSPLVGAFYNVAAASAAGERPWHGINVLGSRVLAVRVKDLKDGRPVALGTGTVPCHEAIEVLSANDFEGPVVFEWDRAWLADLETAEKVLPGAIRTMAQWAAGVHGARASHASMR